MSQTMLSNKTIVFYCFSFQGAGRDGCCPCFSPHRRCRLLFLQKNRIFAGSEIMNKIL